jgi:K(+)-stimulated pyrophosphate-energized sodium pump
VFCFALALPFFNPYFFIGYLIGIAFFGLFQAIFMANAGGAWDNAKKIVEVDLRQKGTDLHAATVVGDTVGDPFKDTSSVALNPVIKFTTLFGLLAVEIAVTMKDQTLKTCIGGFFFTVALVFVYRSFYSMRIPDTDTGTNNVLVLPHAWRKTHTPEYTATTGKAPVTDSKAATAQPRATEPAGPTSTKNSGAGSSELYK